MSKDTVIVIKESVAESIVSDLYTLATVIIIIGMGVWLDSAAMQWVGFVLVFSLLVSKGHAAKVNKTPQQAADFLHAEYGVKAEELS